MVMKAMLIGLLVIGAVAMLETDANAFYHCRPWPCLEFARAELEKVVSEVKKHEGSEVWLIGFTDQKSPEEYRSMESKIEVVQLLLKQHGLQPDIIRSLVLGGYAPLDPKQRGIKAIVTWPKR